MTTNSSLMQQIASAIAKSLTAQGNQVSFDAVLNAVAASDFSRDPVCDKHEEPFSERQPTELWIGIYQYKHGRDLYASYSEGELREKRKEVGLRWIQREYADDPEITGLTDEEKAAYFWHNYAAEESFEIECVSFNASASQADTPSVAVSGSRPEDLKPIWVGIHTHKHGMDVFPALTQEAVYARRQAIALENIETEMPEYRDQGRMTDAEKASYYWRAIGDTRQEFFEIGVYDLEEAEGCGSKADEGSAVKQPQLEISTMLVASTGHVTDEERRILDQHDYCCGDTGWFIAVSVCENEPVIGEIPIPSEGLAGAIRVARDAGCHYLLLDKDAEKIDGVATYDW